MNATLFLMGSALVTGGDPGCAGCATPAPVAHYAPVSVYSHGNCDSCGSPGLLSKLKAKFASGSSRPGLFSKLCHKKEPCDPCATPAVAYASPCALPAVPGLPAGAVVTGTAPQAMPAITPPATTMPGTMPGVPPAGTTPATPAKPISTPEPVPAPSALPAVAPLPPVPVPGT